MKHLFLAAGLVTVLAALHANAQTLHQVATANIPFDFEMNGLTIPAGQYRISESEHILILDAKSGKANAVAIVEPAVRSKAPNYSSLQFHVYGKEYFLSRIWTAGSTEGLALPRAKREKELLSRSNRPQTSEIALNKTDNATRDGR